ncbi:O-antigen ligase family protein, partial [Patescibacteria group bacterium]|nr:O-antigen ligase family protein [Patescibacteria group bacterium]
FLLIFIPLYPKLPLLDAIPGYIVRVRIEDLLVLATGLVWLNQLLRKKIQWRTSFHFLIIAYALAGLLSLLVATALQQTIPLQFVHLGKSLLHYFRYLEYFSLFLFMYSGVKTKRQAQIALTALVVVLNLVFIYGVGQRYFHWPAFSTMNREYSKGQLLFLNPADKLQSTFGGHYDLAAWLLIVVPLSFTWILSSSSLFLQLWLGLSVVSGGWLLWESGSKTALAGCLVSLSLPLWFWLRTKLGVMKTNLVILGGAGVTIIVAFSILWLWQKPLLYKLAPFLRPAGFSTPIDATSLKGDETWSLNARKYGLSMGIRLDTLWPQALDGFSINPFTGKGYATLNRVGETEFTQADGTDNNFLRVLGETGLLGFIAFFGIIVLIVKTLLLKLPKDKLNQTLTIGLLAATVGLFINAFIIDVFAASKVAFTYWAMAGLTLKSYTLLNEKIVKQQELARLKRILSWLKKFWPILVAGIFLILLVHKRPFSEYSLVKSFALSSTSAKYTATSECWLTNMNWQNWMDCFTKYQPGIGATYSLYLLPFYLLYHEPAMFYFANLILMIGSVFLLDLLIRKFTPNSIFRFLLLLLIFTTPSFYSLPTKSSPINLWLLLLLIIIYRSIRHIRPRPISKLWNYLFIVFTLIHLGLVQHFLNMTGSILASFRDTYRPSSFVAIRRANRYLPTRVFENKPQPILLTTIEPVLFDLYGQDGYQIQPITAQDLETYRQLIAQNPWQELFITNANVSQQQVVNEAFENYKQQFGIQLKDIDCRQACNYYQLLASEVIIPTQPQTWNHKHLKTISNKLNFLVVSNQLIAELGSSKFLTQKQQQLKQDLINQQPDLIFLVGDASQNREINWGTLFLQRLGASFQTPIVSVLSNYNPQKNTIFGPQFQRFALGDTWFATLDTASHHTNPAQNLFLYDTLLQLEKHPEVKRLYFISQNDQWLQPHPDNYYFFEDFPKELKKHAKVEFKFVFAESSFLTPP